MKNPFRRRPPAAVPAPAAEQAAADALRDRLAAGQGTWRSPLDPDVQERIDAELGPHKEAGMTGTFFGVPITHFNREELIQIISWVASNARDRRRDS